MLNSSRMHLFTIKAHEKIYAHGIRRENKGTTNYPLLQLGENIESLTNTGY